MLDPDHPIAKLLKQDRRFTFDAYLFVFEALRYAQDELGLGSEVPTEAEQHDPPSPGHEAPRSRRASKRTPRHLTGQELCEAIRQFALQQYGYLAKYVFNQWGVKSTSDFGEIVFNLIEIGEMRKTPDDRRDDFDDVFDFDTDLRQSFKITMPD